MIPLGPGLHVDVPEDVYHADPCPAASLSSSVARVMLDQSPLHARLAHPRLNPDFVRDEKGDRARDRGSAAHAMMLGVGKKAKLLDFPDYRKDAAKEARAEAYAAGLIPLLAADLEAVSELVRTGRRQLEQTELGAIFEGGTPETTMVWQDDGAWCRSRIDYMPAQREGHIIVPDYKTTDSSAHPDDFARTIWSQGYDVQAAFYERGLLALFPKIRSVEFVFVVQEQSPPFALSLVGLGGQAIDLARTRVDIALKMWRACMAADRWPGYATTVVNAEVPHWRAQQTELSNMELLDRVARWQRPLGKGEAA